MFKLPGRPHRLKQITLLQVLVGVLVTLIIVLSFALYSAMQNSQSQNIKIQSAEQMLENVRTELDDLKNTDQIKRNDELQQEIANIQKSYNTAVVTYEKLIDFKTKSDDTLELDQKFADSLANLSKRNYDAANNLLSEINQTINQKEVEVAASFTIPVEVPQSNSPPGAGYSSQQVSTPIGNYLVGIVAADIGSTRVIIDTASQADCADDCPALSLADYVSRNGAYAGVNGTYFCPADYPSCADKSNSFDLLVMNKDKTYFNSDNNVYSSNPGAIFGSGYVRFVSSVSQWGRDTSVDGVISNYPLLVFNNNNMFAGDEDPKKGSKAGRSFVASKGSSIYIGVVFNATVAEAAVVLQTMGMENAINLDSGGSTALYSGGYKAGPGRNIPNAVLFVQK